MADKSRVPRPERFSVTFRVVVKALPRIKDPAPIERLKKVEFCPAPAGTSVKDPPALMITMLGNEIPLALKLIEETFDVSNDQVKFGELIAPAKRAKFPLIVIFGTERVALPEKAKW